MFLSLLPSAKGEESFRVDFSNSTGAWSHFWANAVGSDHAKQTLREDWRQAMARGAAEAGFRSVRFHAIFDDDMSTFSADTPSFFNIFQSYDWLVEHGVRPYVELSFMPLRFASNDTFVFAYHGNTSPPRNMTQWTSAVQGFAVELISRYGLEEVERWPFEVWNEPNINFWSGTKSQYFELYEATAHALKRASPRLRVGGPVTANCSWLPEFVDFVQANKVPIDFVSSHLYPTDRPPLRADILPRTIAAALRAVEPLGKPFYLSEYNDGLGIGQHDLSYAAAFIFRNVQAVADLGGLDIFSFWCISDIFEESPQRSAPFSDQFGLLTINGVAKPSFRAFQLLHGTGTRRFAAEEGAGNVGVVAVDSGDATRPDERQVLVWNHAPVQDACPAANVTLIVAGLPARPRRVLLARIDAANVNPKAVWEDKLGKKTYLTRKEVEILHEASEVVEEEIHFDAVDERSIRVTFTAAEQSANRLRIF